MHLKFLTPWIKHLTSQKQGGKGVCRLHIGEVYYMVAMHFVKSYYTCRKYYFLLWSECSEREATLSGFKKNIKKGVWILEFITLYQNALYLTSLRHVLPQCIAPRTTSLEDVTPLSCRHFSYGFQWDRSVVMFCSDLPEWYGGRSAWLSQLLLLFLIQYVEVCT